MPGRAPDRPQQDNNEGLSVCVRVCVCVCGGGDMLHESLGLGGLQIDDKWAKLGHKCVKLSCTPNNFRLTRS